MSVELAQFLSATDLDELQQLRTEIKTISRGDAVVLEDVVTAWADEQAVANLLMYPEVIPERHRVAALLRGLMLDPTHYLLVSAIVGLRRFDMPREHRLAVAQRLRDLVEGHPGTVADLAAGTLDQAGDEPPMLAYIPNLSEWPPRTAPARYPGS